jgi:hypothetical protein
MPRPYAGLFQMNVGTAFHEAGHCVAAYSVGLRIVNLSIVPTPEALGYCHYAGHRSVEQEILVLLAGGVAEALHEGQHDFDGEESDAHAAYALAHRLAEGDGYRATTLLDRHREQARRLLLDPVTWSAVVRIAEALLERGALDGREARRIYRQATRKTWG